MLSIESDRMELVTNRKQTLHNIYTLYRYAHSSISEERAFVERIFKMGKTFVAENIGGKVFFAPSKFVGYVNNNYVEYDLNREEGADGRVTNRSLSIIYGEAKKNVNLLKLLEEECNNLTVNRNFNGDMNISFFYIEENIERTDYMCYFISPTHVSGAKRVSWQSFLDKGIAAIGWNIEDFTNWRLEDIQKRIKEEGFHNETEAITSHGIMYNMQVGDIICATNNMHGLFGIGIVASTYKFETAIHNTGSADRDDWYNN